MSGKAGMVAALESLGAGAEAGEVEDGAQLALLPGLAPALEGDAEGRRGPGRPAGSRNRSTEEWRAYLIRRHGSPLEGLLRVACADTKALGREFGLKPGDALKLQMDALQACLPYLHQKLPQAVELGGNDGPVLVLNVSQQTFNQVQLHPRGGGVRLEGQIEGNQGVGEDDDGEV